MSKNVISMHFALVYLTCELEVKVSRVKVKGHMGQGQIGQGQIRVPNKARWAHINVKFLHLSMFHNSTSNSICRSRTSIYNKQTQICCYINLLRACPSVETFLQIQGKNVLILNCLSI